MKLIATGDVALCYGIERMILNGHGNKVARSLRGILNRADLMMVNLECPLTDSETPLWSHHFPALKGRKSAGFFLGELGVTFASIANNHIADYGLEGMKDTIDVLERESIDWSGGGMNPEQARQPAILRWRDMAIGVVALAQPEISAAKRGKWGAGVLEDRSALQTVRRLNNKVDFIICYLHFGVEFFEYPTPHQVRLSRQLVDAGALMVIGHHPHVVQGYEYYHGGFIAYSLGNFIFNTPTAQTDTRRLGLIILADLKKNAIRCIEVIPILLEAGNPRLLNDEEKRLAEEHISQLCTVIEDRGQLLKSYYFTCRENFNMARRAIFYYGIKRGNAKRAWDILKEQWWPQLLELRIGLIRFLFTGDAYRYERERETGHEEWSGRVWRVVCKMMGHIGFLWGRTVRVK